MLITNKERATTNNAENINKILFVLVLYKCQVEESASFKTLLKEAQQEWPHLFIYDNSPYSQVVDFTIAQYIHDPSNGGISKAYNAACSYALKNHYKWLLFLDQDTEFPVGAINKYRQAIESVSSVEMIAPRHRIQTGEFMSPTRYRMKTSHLQKDTPSGLVDFRHACPINSGILVTTDSFVKAGGYNEAVWLDFSDIRFIEKYKRHYSHFYVIKDLICIQNFSATDHNPDSILKRYRIYLQCAANYPKDNLLDALTMTLTTLRPTISRTIKEKTLKYLLNYWNIYIRKKSI